MRDSRKYSTNSTYCMNCMYDQHRDGQCEDEHYECGRYVRGSGHPYVDEAVVLSSDNIPHISPVVLLFGQILQTRHQNVVVAQEV